MAGFFTRLANRLWRAEKHAQTLTHTIQALVQQTLDQEEQDKELVNLRTPLFPGRKKSPFVEFSLLQRSLVGKSDELKKLFTPPPEGAKKGGGAWHKYLADYMITASIPKRNGQRDLYLLAAYAAPWEELDRADLREGIIEGIAVGFHEDLEAAMRELAR